MNRNTGIHAGQVIGTMGGQQVVGLDIAKMVFQLHTVDMGTGEIGFCRNSGVWQKGVASPTW